MYYNVITEPTKEPLTVDEAKNYLRIEEDYTDDDAMVLMHIAAARERFQQATSHVLVSTEYEAAFDQWPDDNVIRLFKVPLLNVTGITYYDTQGAQQSLGTDDLFIDAVSKPARIAPVAGRFPMIDGRVGGIRLRFTAGYAEGKIPKYIKHALLMMITHFYDNRAEVVTGTIATTMPAGVEAVIDMYSVKEHR